GQPHQAGPLVFSFAHARSHTSIRSIFQFVTSQEADHEVVIDGSGSLGIASSGPGIATSVFAGSAHNTDQAGWHRLDCRDRASQGCCPNNPPGTVPLPRFRPDLSEDSLFL